MISVLLIILKIIGISILVILGLILLILLLVLFVPVRYRAKGTYLDSSPSVEARVTWLLHIVSIKASYCKGNALHIYLKLFGLSIYDNLKPDKGKAKNKKTKLTKNKSKHSGEIQAASTDTNDLLEEESSESEENIFEDSATEYPIITDNETSDVDLETKQSQKESIFQKIKRFFVNILNFFKNIKFTIQKICDTIVKIKSNIKYYLELLQLESTKRAIFSCKKQIQKIIKKLAPRKYQVNLHLGFEDPATMGEVLAVWGMFYPWHQGKIDIKPEFATAVIEGNFVLKGHISVFVFAQAACILFFNKDIKRLIKQLKHKI